MIFDDEGTLIEHEPRRHRMTVEPTRLDELWEKLAHDLHAPIDSSRQEISHYRAAIESEARAAALREVAEAMRAYLVIDDATPDTKPEDMLTLEWDAQVDRWYEARNALDAILTEATGASE